MHIGGVRKEKGEPLDHDPCGPVLALPLRHLCATSAPPHKSIHSSELLRFCACSGYTCATLKSKRRKGMAQIMGGAARESLFRSDLDRYTIC
jgi:hypothetical protein